MTLRPGCPRSCLCPHLLLPLLRFHKRARDAAPRSIAFGARSCVPPPLPVRTVYDSIRMSADGTPAHGAADAGTSKSSAPPVPATTTPGEVSAGVVIVRLSPAADSDGQRRAEALVIRRGNKAYQLPKGHLEGDETAEEAAEREAQEEAGVESPLWVGPCVASNSYEFHSRRRGMVVNKTVHFFLATAVASEYGLAYDRAAHGRESPHAAEPGARADTSLRQSVLVFGKREEDTKELRWARLEDVEDLSEGVARIASRDGDAKSDAPEAAEVRVTGDSGDAGDYMRGVSESFGETYAADDKVQVHHPAHRKWLQTALTAVEALPYEQMCALLAPPMAAASTAAAIDGAGSGAHSGDGGELPSSEASDQVAAARAAVAKALGSPIIASIETNSAARRGGSGRER